MRAVLHRALERIESQSECTPRIAVRERRFHAIITQCDIAGEKHETVARNLGLSLRQFYRERGAAFNRLRDALHEELAAGGAEARTNLPWQPTSFVGRQREIEEIDGLIGPRRLVTVTGSGGTGKTRIAVEVALRRKPPHGGTWFVDLAAVNDDALVLNKIAAVLDVRLSDKDDHFGMLLAAITSRELMLILDNCEHVIGAVRAIAEAILQGCPQIALVATSRERLGITGELTYPLSTLSVPNTAVATAAEGRSYAALELFAERAATAQHGVALTDEQFEGAAEICRRLDGIALSIELAAARLPFLGLPALQAQLTQHFRVIAGGSHDLPARHHTLDAMISWSYGLLDETNRTVLRRLAVFARGWTLEAAEAVCADDALKQSAVLDALFSLVEKSLVVVDLSAPMPRYSFFESTRAYALERLTEVGELPELSRRHAQWMAAFADRAYDDYQVMPRLRWEPTVAPELDNVLAALEWALSTNGDPVLAARAASGLQGFWISSGLGAYGRRYIDAALERIEPTRHPVLVARLLLAQSTFLYGTRFEDVVKRAIAILEISDDRRMLARGYVYLAFIFLRTERLAQAEEAGDTARALLHEVGLHRTPLYVRYLCDRSSLRRMQGHSDEAKELLVQAVSLASSTSDVWALSLCQLLLAEIEFATDNPQRAVEVCEETLVYARRVHQEVFVLCNLACYRLATGDVDGAEANAREAINLASSSDECTTAASIQHLAMVAALRRDPIRAARLLGYVGAWYERTGTLRDTIDQKSYESLTTNLHEQLSETEIMALTAQGEQLSQDAAVDEALCKC
ncbi:MAG: ATP-binding protein [Vulcanimicrobiaceae bacterium]